MFTNDNGLSYNILATLEFNEADKEYYKNSWQKHKAVLLERNGEYIVANYVGEASWGFGRYYDNAKDAELKFNEVVQGYLM